ncbi:methylmalonyl-CoA mutase family protein [Fodinicola acaciae]|uniref:methylmalonyl-CoA mutase family protein n=1 Tax=Fodinicola acaciae TaxID=2681555 RepID=UPI0013D247E5|nr:methylmalonyl-CoA mutase family protein [Fodinicola acaciae]
MTASEKPLTLAADFPPASRDDWRALVEKVVGKAGLTPDALVSHTYDGIELRPLYTIDDSVGDIGLPGLSPYVRGSRPQGAVPDGWDVRQRHARPDPAAVLADLENGVTSLWLAGIAPEHLPAVLSEVYLDLAPVVLDAGEQAEASAAAMFELYEEKSVPASAARGNLGADPIGLRARTGRVQDLDVAVRLAKRCVADFPQLRAVVVDGTPYHEAGASEAQELGVTIATGVAYLRALTDAGLSIDDALRQLEFRYAATADQFLTIAKLRAARRLWSRVADVSGGSSGAQHQHAVTSAAMMTRRDPWVNMLRTTLACFGAGIGGAEAITVLPFDAALGLPDAFARRIARNTHALLMAESHVARVIDPSGGSWYVERLTDDLARAGWTFFQELEKAGGLPAALRLAAEKIAATQERRRDDIAHRRQPITGVSEFPHLAEKPVVRPAAPTTETGGLPRIRYAEDFERLRDRSDAVLEKTGERPKVFLATLDKVAVHTARSTFAANLLQAGGIEPVAGPPEDFAGSGAKIACVCSSDEVYVERAEETVKALRAAGAERVLVAGRRSYGADQRIFADCNAIEVLTSLMEVLA